MSTRELELKIKFLQGRVDGYQSRLLDASNELVAARKELRTLCVHDWFSEQELENETKTFGGFVYEKYWLRQCKKCGHVQQTFKSKEVPVWE